MTDLKLPTGTLLNAAMLDAMVEEGLGAAQIAAIVKAALPAPKPRGRKAAQQSLIADPTPREELERVLDPDRAAAVLDHRQRLRAPLTAHAAKLLAAKFGEAGDPNAAADLMVANGWRGFSVAWLKPSGRAPAGRSALASFTDQVREL